MFFKKMVSILLAVALTISMAATVSASGQEGEQPNTQVVQTSAQQEINSEQNTTISVANITMPELIVGCKTALLISSDTGEVLYDKNADQPAQIASITKVMTLILAMEALDAGKISMTDTVPVSDHAYSMGGSQIWLEPGEIFTLEEMIKAICVSSANDAAVAVAEFVSGSEPAFVEAMNKKALELGMETTVFKNACGLDLEGQVSCAKDVAIMSMELLKHEEIYAFTSIWTDTLREGETHITNTNKLLKRYSGITGLKTGTTSRAGFCITATATRDDMGLIAVVLGGDSSEDRFEAATTMLDYGFANYQVVPFPVLENFTEKIKVVNGVENEVTISAQLPKKIFTNKDNKTQFSLETQLPLQLDAPVQKDAQVAEIALKQGEDTVATYPVTADSFIEKMNFKYGFDVVKNSLFVL